MKISCQLVLFFKNIMQAECGDALQLRLFSSLYQQHNFVNIMYILHYTLNCYVQFYITLSTVSSGFTLHSQLLRPINPIEMCTAVPIDLMHAKLTFELSAASRARRTARFLTLLPAPKVRLASEVDLASGLK